MVSEIQGSSSAIVQSTNTEHRSEQINSKKDGAAKTEAAPAAPASSSVNLTQAASQLQALEKTIASSSEVDQNKVEAVRKSINEGSYNVDAERIATKLIDFDTALPKES